jgi:tricorn protease
LGELIGELNAGHTYVFDSPDMPAVDRIDVGVLGCELVADRKYYKIGTIFPGQNWDNNLRSPLTVTGVDVKSGDYILEIDGNTVTTDMNPYRFLENKTNREVTLRVNNMPDKNGSREVIIRPIPSERAIRHLAWIVRNRTLVDQLSGGRIGYIYVPNTAFAGFKYFFQGFREQFTKDGLIIDERYNGGGHLPADMVFEMSHPVLQYWAQRNLDLQSTPLPVHEGPKVMLINGRASSGGDAFPAYFRKMKLGPLMGQTTWGGLIGYGYSPAFVDNGRMAVPSSAFVNTEGEWDVEYYGVEPDIEVFDNPALIQAGREPMLEKAVEYILEELKKNPPKKVTMPEYPDRN